jgi:hypothetical protein
MLEQLASIRPSCGLGESVPRSMRSSAPPAAVTPRRGPTHRPRTPHAAGYLRSIQRQGGAHTDRNALRRQDVIPVAGLIGCHPIHYSPGSTTSGSRRALTGHRRTREKRPRLSRMPRGADQLPPSTTTRCGCGEGPAFGAIGILSLGVFSAGRPPALRCVVLAVPRVGVDDAAGHVGGTGGAHDQPMAHEQDRPGELVDDAERLGEDVRPTAFRRVGAWARRWSPVPWPARPPPAATVVPVFGVRSNSL